jgi:hypothetical protein
MHCRTKYAAPASPVNDAVPAALAPTTAASTTVNKDAVHTLTDEHTVSKAPLNDASTADANLQSKRDRKRLDLSSTRAQCCDEAPEQER